MHHYSHLEDYIKQFYTQLGITDPSLLNFKEIGKRMGLKVFYWPDESQALFIDDSSFIFINEQLPETLQWQDFCHELCHVILHTGDQFYMPPLFREYQEHKANNFMYHACIPTFMLDALDLYDCTPHSIKYVQQLFNVEYDFAKKRLLNYISKKALFQIGTG